jgi:CBS domain-containing protein
MIRVSEVMDRHPEVIPPTTTLREFADLFVIGREAPRHQAFLVVEAAGHLLGIVTKSTAMSHLLSQDVDEDTPILEVCTRDLIVAYTDELLSQASNKMLKHGVGRLPVVHRDDPEKLVGYLGRAQIVEARQQILNEEHVRERGWLLSR